MPRLLSCGVPSRVCKWKGAVKSREVAAVGNPRGRLSRISLCRGPKKLGESTSRIAPRLWVFLIFLGGFNGIIHLFLNLGGCQFKDRKIQSTLQKTNWNPGRRDSSYWKSSFPASKLVLQIVDILLLVSFVFRILPLELLSIRCFQKMTIPA